MHASLLADGVVFFGCDMVGQEGYQAGTNIAMTLNFTSEEETRRVFEYLSQGADVSQPLRDEFRGALFGYLVDQYGICRMFNHQKTPVM